MNELHLPKLYTLKQFCAKHPAFTNGGMRDQIFHSETNGLLASGALIRNGRRVLIEEKAFFAWLYAQNKRTLSEGEAS